jgi:hypothetical protein
MHGCDSYADYVLQHSLLGSSQAAHAFCKRLAAELQPAAAQAVDSWQQAQGQPQVQEQQELSGGDVPRCARQVRADCGVVLWGRLDTSGHLLGCSTCDAQSLSQRTTHAMVGSC